ncbi:MAG TPA: bifunctional aspartate kinase/homoserine dehydrogenase I [Planctomycetota bacterium]|nr:bifunctional aspartate kinase/homoserine dehydrogenase I [Planctomycetota bacterium]
MTAPLPGVMPIAHKFGGTSVADATRIAHVVDILVARNEPQVVVVSAMKGVTDALIDLVHRAAARDGAWRTGVDELAVRHAAAASALLGEHAEPVLAWLRSEFAALHDLLHAQALVGSVADDLLDFICGLGEVWSSRLVDAALRARGAPSCWLDAREVLVVESSDLGAVVQWDVSRQRLTERRDAQATRTVIPGFVARTSAGRLTTLGRNGSDYSAAIFAALFAARELHVWSDVDGVLSADPRLVPEAVLIERLSYSEACELAYFGAKVLHPQTMAPAIERGIPLIARNSFRPEHPGTRIDATGDLARPVKGITTFGGLAILNLEGAGMIGVPGTAERAFAALKQARVSVVMISQGSSEHSICCVIRAGDAEQAQRAMREEFARELTNHQISDVSVDTGVAALAVVGDGMSGTPGVASRLFASLARANVNVRVIAQGASERNISVAIDADDAARALRAVHAGFYLSALTISLGLIGPGHVGGAFLLQVQRARARLLSRHNIDLRIRAIAGATRMVLGEPQVRLPHERDHRDRGTDLEAFASHVQTDYLPHAVIVDCSASDAVADHYAGWLERGIHVITPNKHAGAGPGTRHAALRGHKGQFRYESTVGAGLPIITTVRDLIDTGDEIHAIDGILSGTLAYLFNRFDGSVPFSELVREARRLGYTEPDPRDDLSGRDVARKLVILARESGVQTEVDAIQLESLVPAALREVPLETFLSRLEQLDEPMTARLAEARERGRVLRHVAHFEAGGKVEVGLAMLPSDHAFAHIRLTDNVVQFTTARYRENPLVVQGPGAGPEVTAMGVFADLLRVAASLGARL